MVGVRHCGADGDQFEPATFDIRTLTHPDFVFLVEDHRARLRGDPSHSIVTVQVWIEKRILALTPRFPGRRPQSE